MDDDSGVLATLTQKGAKYHKLCRNKYDEQKLKRLSSPVSVIGDTIAECSLMNTRSSATAADIKTLCIFCDGGPSVGSKLLNASTTDIGPKVHAQAVEMQDTQLLAKLSSTDFIAMEVKYHHKCFTQFRNKHRSYQRATLTTTPDHPYRFTYGSIITELVQYIEKMFLYSNTAPIFLVATLQLLTDKRRERQYFTTLFS